MSRGLFYTLTVTTDFLLSQRVPFPEHELTAANNSAGTLKKQHQKLNFDTAFSKHCFYASSDPHANWEL